MEVLIDADMIKYQVGFACQSEVHHCPDGDYKLTRVDGVWFRECLASGEKAAIDAKTKAEALEAIGCRETEIVPDDIANCLHSVKTVIKGIQGATKSSSVKCYLTKGENFRHKLFPDYKANRKDVPKPVLLPDIESYIKSRYKTVVCEGIEADDAIGIEATRTGSIIASCDKDLDCIPGVHYNWNKQSLYTVTKEEAAKNFWLQVLTGDSVDGIPGLKGVGPKTAEKILDGVQRPDFKQVVQQEYSARGHDEDYFRMNCQLLWILRKPLKETYPELTYPYRELTYPE